MGSAGDRCVCPLYHVFSSTQSSSLCFHMHVSTNVVPPPSLHYISLDALSLFSEPLLPIRVSVCRSSPAVPSLPEGSKLQNKWPCFLTTQARNAEVLLDSPISNLGLSPGISAGHTQSFPLCNHSSVQASTAQAQPVVASPHWSCPPLHVGHGHQHSPNGQTRWGPQFFTSFLAQHSGAPVCFPGLC